LIVKAVNLLPQVEKVLGEVIEMLDHARMNCKPRGQVGRFLFEVGHQEREHGTIQTLRALLAKLQEVKP
jgi:hypothetical protein